MTIKELEQYRSLKREIENQEARIDSLYDKEITTVQGKVKSSTKSFPYTEVRVGVLMEDPTEARARDELIAKKRIRIIKCRKLVLEIEEFISAIQDSELRRIFELRFIDGKKQREIAKEVNIERSYVSKKIYTYLQCFTQFTKTV